jgi:hypothetical protein
MTHRHLLAGAALLVVALSACAEDSSNGDDGPAAQRSTSAAPDPAPSPQCDEVWVKDQELPRPYDGCYDESQRVAPDGHLCEFGRPIVTYADRFYAVPGGTIHQTDGPLADDRGYRSDMKSCMA